MAPPQQAASCTAWRDGGLDCDDEALQKAIGAAATSIAAAAQLAGLALRFWLGAGAPPPAATCRSSIDLAVAAASRRLAAALAAADGGARALRECSIRMVRGIPHGDRGTLRRLGAEGAAECSEICARLRALATAARACHPDPSLLGCSARFTSAVAAAAADAEALSAIERNMSLRHSAIGADTVAWQGAKLEEAALQHADAARRRALGGSADPDDVAAALSHAAVAAERLRREAEAGAAPVAESTAAELLRGPVCAAALRCCRCSWGGVVLACRRALSPAQWQSPTEPRRLAGRCRALAAAAAAAVRGFRRARQELHGGEMLPLHEAEALSAELAALAVCCGTAADHWQRGCEEGCALWPQRGAAKLAGCDHWRSGSRAGGASAVQTVADGEALPHPEAPPGAEAEEQEAAGTTRAER
eukprot:TRINITY_DN8310_c1_g1_i1.p2 TRINITY_DN8310_c1_g1~~TRINITY_DN8310_c1_g1_i1.p2  ORF type:complete len:419 (+),score=91.90 TRINITY_DN8310_c1_g1_i1:364-1620(+)